MRRCNIDGRSRMCWSTNIVVTTRAISHKIAQGGARLNHAISVGHKATLLVAKEAVVVLKLTAGGNEIGLDVVAVFLAWIGEVKRNVREILQTVEEGSARFDSALALVWAGTNLPIADVAKAAIVFEADVFEARWMAVLGAKHSALE